MQPMPPPQMFFNYPNTAGYPDPRGHLLAPYDPYYYASPQPQHYYTPGNFPNGSVYPSGYRPQMQSAPPPRPYLTITQFNYQPIGYHHGQSQPTATTNLVFGPPPRDRRCGGDAHCRFISGTSQYDIDRSPSPARMLEQPRILYQRSSVINDGASNKRNNLKSDSSDSFEFTIQPEQIVNAVCDEKELECTQCRSNVEPLKLSEEIGNDIYCSPRVWPNCEIMDPMRIEDDDLTKFIVEGCLKAEAIAVRNQHRPCFKNIKHLCTRTRTDILKPRTTVANIHSQGIPWATKDFIFAFVRLINCWYILKGYLDDHEGSLGKIETALIPEFKECYQRWQNINKDMVKHLINIFVNLDNGITVQNAEIFSSFNQHKNVSPSSCSLPCDNQNNENCPKPTTSKSCPTKISIQEQIYQNKKLKNQSLVDLQSEQKNFNVTYSNTSETCIDDKLKCSYLDGKSVPGILRVKDMFNNPQTIQETIEEDTLSDKVCRHHKIYMKPGSYRVPKKKFPSPGPSPRNEENKEQPSNNFQQNSEGNSKQNFAENQTGLDPGKDDLWKSALESFGPFMETVMKDSESASNSMINESSSFQNSNSNISSGKDSDNTDKNLEVKTSKNKETQAWVNDQDFGSYNEENIEEIPCQPQKSTKYEKYTKNSSKKFPVNSRTYRKRNDDSEYSNKLCRSKNVREFSNFDRNCGKKPELSQTVASMCFLTKRNLGLPPTVAGKFEKIINALWNLQFARYITFEVNAEHVPDYYKYINKPMFLYKVMNNLKQNKYSHPYQVVHDLRTIVRNSELYVEKRPDWWFEKCLVAFSKELETQLAEKFASIDFSSVTGDPLQPPAIEFNIHMKINEEQQ